jgi:hypothetical protein
MRVGNNSRQPGDLTGKRQSDNLKYEHAYSFAWVVEKREILKWMVLMNENQ